MKVLLWIVALVPLAVFGVVAWAVGRKDGLEMLASLVWLVVVVVGGLVVQVALVPRPRLVRREAVADRVPAGRAERDGRGVQHARAPARRCRSRSRPSPVRCGSPRRRASSRPASGPTSTTTGRRSTRPPPCCSWRRRSGFQLTFADQVVVAFTTIFASIGAGLHPVRELRDAAADLRGRAASPPTRSRSSSRSTGSSTAAGPRATSSAT